MSRQHSYNIAHHIEHDPVLDGFTKALAASGLPANATLADLLQRTYDNGFRDGRRDPDPSATEVHVTSRPRRIG